MFLRTKTIGYGVGLAAIVGVLWSPGVHAGTVSKLILEPAVRGLATEREPVPVVENGVRPVGGYVAVVGGEFHTCGITQLGTASCWGSNVFGQLGDGSFNDALMPVRVLTLASGTATIDAGSGHSCALTSGGIGKCWGLNTFGQLGVAEIPTSPLAVNVPDLPPDLGALGAGAAHTCATTDLGGVYCWGSNASGQLGDGTSASVLGPVEVVGLEDRVTAIAGGSGHGCALTERGGVWCWGLNSNGQLGNGSQGRSVLELEPVPVMGLNSGVVAITAGSLHSCALTDQGSVWCWGSNISGQLGNDSIAARVSVPQPVSGLSAEVTAVVAGGAHTCALMSGGTVKCWGLNEYGQLGTGKGTNELTPAAVIGLDRDAVSLGAGFAHTCAVVTEGELRCWGANASGQLGDNSTTNRSEPVPVVEATHAADCPVSSMVALGVTESQALPPLYAFRDRVLPRMLQGAWLHERYYAHSAEVIELLMAKPRLLREARDTLAQLQPRLNDWNRGGLIWLSTADRAAVARFARSLQQSASPALAEDLATFISWL